MCSDHLCLGSVSCIDSEILKIIIVKYVICYHNHVLFLFWQVIFGICVQLLKWKKKCCDCMVIWYLSTFSIRRITTEVCQSLSERLVFSRYSSFLNQKILTTVEFEFKLMLITIIYIYIDTNTKYWFNIYIIYHLKLF